MCSKCQMNRIRYYCSQKPTKKYSSEQNWELTPRATKRIFLPNLSKPKPTIEKRPKAPTFVKSLKARTNEMGIQMLSRGLYEQVFKGYLGRGSLNAAFKNSLEQCRETLKKHGMISNDEQFMKEINFELPKMKGDNIEEHFRIIGKWKICKKL